MRRLMVITLLMGLCACQPAWQQAHKGQGDLARDQAECEAVATQAGLSHSLTGRRPVLSIYNRAFVQCMVKKGWHTQNNQGTDEPAPVLLKPAGEGQWKFDGRTVTLPPHASAVHDSGPQAGPLTMQIVRFQSDNPKAPFQGEMIFQASSGSLGFSSDLFPVAAPLFTYDKGRLKNGSEWRAFSGTINRQDWLGGVGVYWKTSSRRRVIITITTTLPGASTEEIPGVRMTRQQAATMDCLLEAVLPWLNGLGGRTLDVKAGSWGERGWRIGN